MTRPANPALIPIDPFTSAKSYQPEVLAKAYEMYLQTGMDIQDIAIGLGLPIAIVAAWARQGKWADRKQQIVEQMMRAAEAKYTAWMLENKLPTLKQHLEVAQELEKKIKDLVTNARIDSPKDMSMLLKRLAEALAATSAVGARSVGMTEEAVRRPQGNAPAPLLVFAGGGPAVPASSGSIDITPEVDTDHDTISRETPSETGPGGPEKQPEG